MAIKVAINGFGRIGRCVARIIANRDDVELVAIVSKIAHPFKMLTEVERVAKGQVSKDNMDQTTSVEDEFIKRIGQDQESAELATRLLSKIKDSN